MDAFIQRHEQDVIGGLNGFDRMRFRGTLRSICYSEGLDRYLGAVGVPYKDFGVFAQSLSERLKDHAREVARKAGRPFEYLTRSSQEKEKVAQAIATREGVTEGLVCALVRGAVPEFFHSTGRPRRLCVSQRGTQVHALVFLLPGS